MFLLPSAVLGVAFATLLGGRLERLGEIRLRAPGLAFGALGVQLVLFTRLGSDLSTSARSSIHIASYVLLIAFAARNARTKPLLLLTAGMLLNAIVIIANGGRMPVAGAAARAVGLGDTSGSNVEVAHGRLRFLGDVFALPHQVPLANVFSVGDILIAVGVVVFIVFATLEDSARSDLKLARILRPLQVPAYRKLAAGKLISTTGDWLTMAALVGWVYGRTHSTAAVAVLMLVRVAPPVLGGGVAAMIVDRLAKDRLLVWVEVSRGATAVAALGGVLTHRMWIVMLAIALSGMLSATGRTAVPALVPTLLPEDQLEPANASLGVAEDAAMALGSVLAGIALASVGTAPALAADLATFAVAALLFSAMRVRRPLESGRGRAPESGIRYLLARRRLLLLVASFSVATLATGTISVTLPRFLGQDIGFSNGGYGFGFGALALGLAAGQALAGFGHVGDHAGRWIGIGIATMGATFVLLGLSMHAPTVLLLLACAGVVDGTTDVVFRTVIQRDADPRYYGAVFGFAGAAMRSTMMVGVGLGPLANQLLDPRQVVVASGFLLLASSTIALAIGRPVPAAERAAAIAPAA